MLEKFLNTKPLYYDAIDYTRMPRVYESLKHNLKLPKIIHIIGTNGKGTTGRFLATALFNMGKSVGHYTSPHILNFNERVWINGAESTNEKLDEAHQKLLELLSKEDANSLSYFEYTTLLAMYMYQDLEYVVLEAGLGGEHDATAVFSNILTLITPIDKDHEAFLGNDIVSIATTKLNAIKKNAILAKQKHKDVGLVAEKLAVQKSLNISSLEEYLTQDDREKIKLISKDNSLVPYLQDNLTLSISALKFLGLSYEIHDFSNSKLFGRLTRFKENILLDVGHNTLAASSIYESLKGLKYTLVYNSFKDKDYEKILKILQPIISDIEVIKIDDKRAESLGVLQESIENLGYKFKLYTKSVADKNYLVFGSFSVVEAFLKENNE